MMIVTHKMSITNENEMPSPAPAPAPVPARVRAIYEPRKMRPLWTLRKNWELLLLCLPAVTCYALFHYAPMGGIIMAFKNYRYIDGIFGSPWVGLKNFEYFFKSVDLWIIVRNTVGYNLLFIIVSLISCVSVALLLYEINSRPALKTYQTIITFPNFLSWVIVGYITYALFNPTLGLLNNMRTVLDLPPIDVYIQKRYWPFILVIVNSWKGIGMGCLMYYAALIGIDPTLYEAAKIDGANRWQQTWHISLTSLTPLMTIMTIMAVGSIFRGDFGLFYQIPRNVGVINDVTEVIDTYVYRGLRQGAFGMSSAVGFVQSVVGFFFVLATNYVVKKIAPENSMF